MEIGTVFANLQITSGNSEGSSLFPTLKSSLEWVWRKTLRLTPHPLVTAIHTCYLLQSRAPLHGRPLGAAMQTGSGLHGHTLQTSNFMMQRSSSAQSKSLQRFRY